MAAGLMLVLSAPSGTGKTTLARRLLELEPDGVFSVSATTRPPRGNERQGVDYDFLDEAGFDARIERGELLEWAEVHGRRYGTPRRYADEAERGRLVVFDIDVKGGMAIKARHPAAATLYVLPPSHEELERRLRQRGTEDAAAFRARLAAAEAEVAEGLSRYDWVLVNDDLASATAELAALVRVLRGTGTPADRRAADRLRGERAGVSARWLG